MKSSLSYYHSLVPLVHRTFIIIAVIFTLFDVDVSQQIGVNSPNRGFYPAGSYSLSDLETISTRNGNLIMHFPLVSLPPGRGGMTSKIGLYYNSKLWEAYSSAGSDQDGNQAIYEYLRQSSTGGWQY